MQALGSTETSVLLRIIILIMIIIIPLIKTIVIIKTKTRKNMVLGHNTRSPKGFDK